MSIAKYDGLYYKTDDEGFLWHINNGKSEPYPRELELIKRYLTMYPNKNNTFIDIGGHIGTISLPYSRLFKNIIAYEPNIQSYNFFKENIILNNISNIELHNKGIYNKNTKCSVIQHGGGNSGCFYIKEHDENDENDENDKNDIINEPKTDLVEVIKLDDIYLDANYAIDFIKIDIEGSEIYALEGAFELIIKWKPLIQVKTSICSDKYFGYNKDKIFSFLNLLNYKIYDNDGNNPLFYYPNNVIYCFWTGDNYMSITRFNSLSKLREYSGVDVKLISNKNLHEYILENEPLHPAYEYLSETHKADFLRTYFMNFYGGGYSDIKQTTGSWQQCFHDLLVSDKWICGYKELEGGVGYKPHADYWRDLIGNGAYICKPQTELTKKWYSEMISFLDGKLEQLKLNPSKNTRDSKESGSGYPIEWNEMLGRIFHRVSYDYKDKILNTLPISIFYDYM
jgi:FkbM family methyltransferase